MTATARKADPALWQQVKEEVTRGSKGGRPGQWSARKAQLATTTYKQRGGGYVGPKSADNHLRRWTREDWGTASGKPSGETGERYLPRQARLALTASEYRSSSDKKRRDTEAGKQVSAQPPAIAAKTGCGRGATKASAGQEAGQEAGQKTRGDRLTRAALLAKAAERRIAGRSRMTKAQLVAALST